LYVHLIGESDTGKSVLSMTCFAEAARNPQFDDYLFVHDNAEHGVLMDIEEFYGASVAKRLQDPPLGISEYLEDFYFNLWDLFKKKQPFIYVLDSMDVLDTRADEKKFQQAKKAAEKGNDAAGSMGMAKAKMNSEYLRKVRSKLQKSGSILIVISQARDAGPPPPGTPPMIAMSAPKKTRAGGRALKFYARLEVWSSHSKDIREKIRDKNRQLGIVAQLNITKNHLRGKKSQCKVPIYHSFGFDDIGSNIDYLIEEDHWKVKKGQINAKEFDVVANKKKLIRHVEKNDLEHDLKEIVSEVWHEIEEACQVKRKKRYQ
jgi:hypothetical protein